MPGKFDNERMRKLLQSSAKLEFWETYENKEVYEKIVLLNTRLSEELFPELKDTVVESPPAKLEGASMEDQFAAQKSEKEIEEEKMANIKKQNPLFSYLSPAYHYNSRQQIDGLSDGPIVGYALLYVKRERTIKKRKAISHSYYLSSISTKAKEFAKGIRHHWGIENRLHYVKDVTLKEDESRIRSGNAPAILSLIRNLVINIARIKGENRIKKHIRQCSET